MRAVEIFKGHENAIRERYHVKRIGVFGSFARGEEREGSDVDVLIELEEEYETFDNYMDPQILS